MGTCVVEVIGPIDVGVDISNGGAPLEGPLVGVGVRKTGESDVTGAAVGSAVVEDKGTSSVGGKVSKLSAPVEGGCVGISEE